MGFNIIPILTGAGILGIAISLGAQTLIKDVISGIFLIIDDQINIGDRVKIEDQEGVIVKMFLRNIVLQDKAGNRIYIPNSEINKIIVYKQKS